MLPSSLPLTVGGNVWMQHRPWHALLTQNCCQQAQNICFGHGTRATIRAVGSTLRESRCQGAGECRSSNSYGYSRLGQQ